MKRRIFITFVCSFLSLLSAFAQKSLSWLQYWIDSGEKIESAFSENDITLAVDASSLTEGLHTFYYRVKDSEGMYSPLKSWIILRKGPDPIITEKNISLCQYWIDSGEKIESAFSENDITLAVDASSLTEGLHTFYYRVKDSEGMYSPLKSWIILRKGPDPIITEKNISLCQYWVDGGGKKESAFSGNDITLVVDASSLIEGLHTFYYRVKDSEGMYSPLRSWIFLRKGQEPVPTENRVSYVEYWLDNDIEHKTTLPMGNETFLFTVDASSLSSGLHKLIYCVRDELGFYCAPKMWLFYKPEETIAETRKIAWLKYWWNDHTEKIVKEDVTEGNTTYSFVKEVVVPEYAKTDDKNYIARFCYVVGDDAGNISPTKYIDIEYSDNKAPVSAIEASAEVAEGSVVLNWHTVSDVAQEYNVYFSEEDGPFVLWLPNTTKTTATFKGKAGMTYRFTVIARDKTGDQEKYDENKFVKVLFKSN